MSETGEHPEAQEVLDAYFKDLEAALAGLPRARREQLADEIREHVTEARAEQPPEFAGSVTELRNLLDRVGRPEDIAAAAREEEPESRRPPLRTWQRVLIAGAGVVILAGIATGMTFALSSHTPARPHAAAGGHPVIRQSAAAKPSASAVRASPSASPSAPGARAVGTQAAAPPVLPSAPASPTAPAILAPATVPPVSAECTEPVTYEADGNVSPLTCANGGVNTVAWHHYTFGESGTAPTGPELFTLGLYAGPSQVYQAMCHDYETDFRTVPLTVQAETLAQAYYGWQFAGDNPVKDFQSGCPAPAESTSPSASGSPVP